MRRVEHDEVGLLTERQAGDAAARRLGAALHRRQGHRGGHLRLRITGRDVAPARRQALAVFEQHQFFGRVDADMAVGARAPGAARGAPGRQVEDAVAQVGFGARAQPGHRAARRSAPVFIRIHVGRMHQAPARIDRCLVEQPRDRALAAPGAAVIDLLRLLGNVDVNRRRRVDRGQARERIAQGRGRHGAQRVRRQAEPRALGLGERLQALQQAEHRVGRADEAALAFVRRQAAEAAGLIEHRQQRKPDAGAPGRPQQRQRQRRVVGIRPAIGGVVQVVELADGGVAGFQHLDVQTERDGLELVRGQARSEAVHQRAPGPETVVLSGAGSTGTTRSTRSARPTAKFGQAGHGALEGVRMQVRHAGQQWAAGAGRVWRRLHTGAHLRQPAGIVPAQQHVAGPAGGQQRIGREQAGVLHEGLGHDVLGNDVLVHDARAHEPAPTAMRPCRTTVRTGRWPNQ